MRILILCLVAALGSLTVHSQERHEGIPERPMLTDSAATLIGLSPDQLQGWRDLGTQYQEELDQLKDNKGYSDEDMRQWWKRRDEALREFLSPEQYEKWIKLDKDVQGKLAAPAKRPVHG